MSRLKDAFSGFEFKDGSFLSSRAKSKEEQERYGPHMKRLPKSTVPEYLTLTKYQKFCWKVMGPVVERRGVEDEQLKMNLLQAHMKIRVEEYIAYVWMTTIFAAIGGIIGAIALSLILSPILGILAYIVAVATLVFTPLATYFGLRYNPVSKANRRGKKIDDKLADAMSFIASMASANINIDMIFKELAKQPLYGEVCEEAKWITRDTEILGMDILNALDRASDRCPSDNFREFLQGVVTTSTSGGQLKPYFKSKMEEYQDERKLQVQQNMETLGMLAESFVTVVVAFPLFLVVIMAIMSLMGGMGGGNTIPFLYAVVGLMIPGSQAGFIFIIWLVNQD
ncbi:MAG: type II secretion system F family protein [Candidatus Thermoplasmatota archaeon]|nr:type II secretion system F family protein [Candidatus Thermoplasmatota archaeon]MBS3789986.1 type II secretion system F family protein [Candidatus Thermoplasmatota archaeon]